MLKALAFALTLIGFSASVHANDKFYNMDETASFILRNAQHCSYQISFSGMVDSPRNGVVPYVPAYDGFTVTQSGLTVWINRQPGNAWISEPSSSEGSMKTFVLEGQSFRGVRMDYKGFNSASIFCYYMTK